MNALWTKKRTGSKYWLKSKNVKNESRKSILCWNTLSSGYHSASLFLRYAQIKSWWLNSQSLICQHLINRITPTYISESICKYKWWDKSKPNLKSSGRIQFPWRTLNSHWNSVSVILDNVALLIDTLIPLSVNWSPENPCTLKGLVQEASKVIATCSAWAQFYLTRQYHYILHMSGEVAQQL